MSDGRIVEAAGAETPASAAAAPFDLSKFVLDRVLSNATSRKMISCLGRFSDRGSPTDRAIVILEKSAFAEADLVQCPTADGRVDAGAYFSSSTQLLELFVNDIYGNFECFPSPGINRNC